MPYQSDRSCFDEKIQRTLLKPRQRTIQSCGIQIEVLVVLLLLDESEGQTFRQGFRVRVKLWLNVEGQHVGQGLPLACRLGQQQHNLQTHSTTCTAKPTSCR